jgi:hypothetical protein
MAKWYIAFNEARFGWNAAANDYGGAEDAFGVKDATGVKGVLYGANTPKPPKVRISTDKDKTYVRYCDPAKLGSVLGTALAGTSFKGGLIKSISTR